MVNVKSHSRRTKTGKTVRVTSHYRNNPESSVKTCPMKPKMKDPVYFGVPYFKKRFEGEKGYVVKERFFLFYNEAKAYQDWVKEKNEGKFTPDIYRKSKTGKFKIIK